jgi:hypothetical protein
VRLAKSVTHKAVWTIDHGTEVKLAQGPTRGIEGAAKFCLDDRAAPKSTVAEVTPSPRTREMNDECLAFP